MVDLTAVPDEIQDKIWNLHPSSMGRSLAQAGSFNLAAATRREEGVTEI